LDSKFIKSSTFEKGHTEPVDLKITEISPESKETKSNIEKIVQSQGNPTDKVAILDFREFEMQDKNELLRTRSNNDFRRRFKNKSTSTIFIIF